MILGRALYAGASQPKGCRAGRQVAEPLWLVVHIWQLDGGQLSARPSANSAVRVTKRSTIRSVVATQATDCA